jgi:DNA-binding NtrC family response regulator
MDELNFLANSLDHFEEKGPYIKFSDNPLIVILDDDTSLTMSLKVLFENSLSAEVLTFNNGSDFLNQFIHGKVHRPFCFITDVGLGTPQDGLFYLDLLLDMNIDFFSIVITGFASIESAINATKKGVDQYLTKPFDLEHLKSIVIQGFARNLNMIVRSDLNTDVLDFGNSFEFNLAEDKKLDTLVIQSEKMQDLARRITKLKDSKASILISGETGTGRAEVAQVIHRLSYGKDKLSRELTSIDCNSVAQGLIESEIFGFSKDAYNEATSNFKGLLSKCDGSNLLIKDIHLLNLQTQSKILNYLKTGKFERIGSEKVFNSSVRIIATTSAKIENLVGDGRFSEDLFYRLNIIPIQVPALRDRKDDIPYFISIFLKQYVSADHRNMITFSKTAFKSLINYHWPENISELEEVIENLVLCKGGQTIQEKDLPSKIFDSNPLTNEGLKNFFELPDEGINLKKVLWDIEESLIIQALERTGGNKNKASKILGLNRTTLLEKMRKKGI